MAARPSLNPADRRQLRRLARRRNESDQALRDAVQEAHANGASTREIAAAIDRPHTTVANWVRRVEGEQNS